jgi:hypothetical protein
MTEDEVAQFHRQVFREALDFGDSGIQHLHAHDDVPDQPARVAVINEPVILKFVDLADVVKDAAGQQ